MNVNKELISKTIIIVNQVLNNNLLFLSRVNVYLTFRMLLYFRISNSVMLSSDNRNILVIGFSFQGTVLNVFFSVFNVIRYNSNGIL